MRVLCIDDDRRLFELLASFFAPNGVTLVHATDGAKGLAALERDVFDAVLLDVMMPGMDGLEVCRRIRQTRQVPVIMLTARGDEADRVVGLELGADDYVPKPFSPRELLARLRAVLRRAQPSAVESEIVIGRVAIDVGARRVRRGRRARRADRAWSSTSCWRWRGGRGGSCRARRCSRRRAATTSRSATAPSTCTSRTCARSWATIAKPPRLIKTVRGVGYVLTPPEARPAGAEGRRRVSWPRHHRHWGHGHHSGHGSPLRRGFSGGRRAVSLGRVIAEARERRPGWRRRIRDELRLHYGAHLHRRLFHWFGAAIFLSVATTCRGAPGPRVAGRASVARRGPVRHPGAVLWTAAGRIARRISRPLYELTRVAQEIGPGQPGRARVARAAGGIDEIGVLSTAFNDMAARLERQLTEQRELLAAVSHELRTPLARIRLLVEIARRPSAPPSRRATLDEIEREAIEIDTLVGELLASARLEFQALTRKPLDGGGGRASRARARRASRRASWRGRRAAMPFVADPTLVGARARQPHRQRPQARRRPRRRRRCARATARWCSRSTTAAPASRPARRRASSSASTAAARRPTTTARSGSAWRWCSASRRPTAAAPRPATAPAAARAVVLELPVAAPA